MINRDSRGGGGYWILLIILKSINTCMRIYSARSVASEAYHDWSGEAAGARLRVNFTLKLLLSQDFCNRPLMRFISFASNIGPAAAVPAGPSLVPRLPRSGTRTLKLCRRGEPSLVFFVT